MYLWRTDGHNFYNLEATLFEAEGLASATSGFCCHKVCIQDPRVDLQSGPNQVGNDSMGKGETAR